MNDHDITVFAETTFRNKNRKFGIKRDDRRRHMYLIGKTGMGKSTILENMIVEDIRAGNGVAVVDPHGDLAEKVIKFVPSSRINDVVYFNPADYKYPVAFNVLEKVDPHLRHLVASGLIGVFQKLWADSWGPRLEYILRNALLAVLDYPDSTLLSVIRMLSDKKFRKKVVDNVEDPVVKAFWVNEFAGYADKFASEAVSPIQNKVGQFLSTALIRNIVGQVKSTIDMREIMDKQKILILNLSKGRIGEDSSQLLGAMIITKIQLAAMSRVDIPEKDRKDFYLYIDEFQNFTTDSFANILSEARKYKLNLVMAHQYIEQLGDVVRNAVFGNVGTLVVFRVGAADAEALELEFTPTFVAEDILNLPKYEIYLKLMIDGIASEPFSARGLYPLLDSEETNNVDKLIAVSRERYAKSKEEVEAKIAKWHESGEETAQKNQANNNFKTNTKNNFANNQKRPSPAQSNLQTRPNPVVQHKPAQVADNSAPNHINEKPSATNPAVDNNQKQDNSSVYKYTVDCNRCGQETKLSFKPDGVRPVYCKNCLSVSKEEKKKEIEMRKKQKEEELKKLKSKPLSNVVNAKKNKPEIQEKKIEEPVNDTPGLSLDQALKMNPVNFKGKVIEKKNKTEEKAEAPPVFKPAPKEAKSDEKKDQNKDELEFVAGESIDFD